MNVQVAKELIQLSLPHMEAFKKDLLFHDMNFLKENPDTSFLHITRKWGTHIIPFDKPEEYPAKGVYVKYLFGTADRDFLLKSKKFELDWMAKEGRIKLLLYFNGCCLTDISMAKGMYFLEHYMDTTRWHWQQSQTVGG